MFSNTWFIRKEYSCFLKVIEAMNHLTQLFKDEEVKETPVLIQFMKTDCLK